MNRPSIDVLRLGRLFADEFCVAYLGDSKDSKDVAAYIEHRVDRGTGDASWIEGAEQPVRIKRSGRIDLLIEWRESSGLLSYVIVEIKSTDWDARAPHRIVPNLGRHRRQLWSYVEPFIPRLDAHEIGGIQAILIYPRRPRTPSRAQQLEDYLGNWAIVPMYAEDLIPGDVPP